VDPAPLYEAIPYLYMVLGAGLLGAAYFMPSGAARVLLAAGAPG
jgi:hypothetical protein